MHATITFHVNGCFLEPFEQTAKYSNLPYTTFCFQIKENMFSANREHKDTLQRMEQKFFEEKVSIPHKIRFIAKAKGSEEN